MRLRRGPYPPAVAPGPPSRPELRPVLGQYPCVAMVDEIEAGNLRALVVGGGNPLHALPDIDRTRAAFASLDVLAVVDVADNELTALATHVLPAAGQLERADITLAENVSLRSGIAVHAGGRSAGRRASAGVVDLRAARPAHGRRHPRRRRSRRR